MEFLLKFFAFFIAFAFEGCHGTPTITSLAQLPESATFLKRLSDEVELKLGKFDQLAEKMESISRTVIASNATLRQEQSIIKKEQENLRVEQSNMKDYREEQESLRAEQSNLLAEQEMFQELFKLEQTKTSSKIKEIEEKQEETITEIKIEIAGIRSQQIAAQSSTNSELGPLKAYIAAVRKFPTTLADLFTLDSTHSLFNRNAVIYLYPSFNNQGTLEDIYFNDCYSSNDCCKPIVKLSAHSLSLRGTGCFVLHHDQNCKLEEMKSKAFVFVSGFVSVEDLGDHINKFRSASTCRHTVFN